MVLPQSLKGKLLLAVAALVIGSGLLISFIVAEGYSRSLLESMRVQAENMAQAAALETAEEILLNDSVALQKTLDHYKRSHPAAAYLFTYRAGDVLAHTFPKGLPVGLIEANRAVSDHEPGFQKIRSTQGERYLDVAWPIFEGKAGVLRLGFSERPYREKLSRLWWQMAALTFGVLVIAVAGALWFIRRITLPLASLATATHRVDQGDLEASVDVRGRDEIAMLAASFNRMVRRIAEYTGRLESQTSALERAHQQARTFCGIVQELGSLRTLREVGIFVVERFRGILKCGDMVLVVLNEDRSLLFVLSAEGSRSVTEPGVVKKASGRLRALKGLTFSRDPLLAVASWKKPKETGPGRYALVPLRVGGECFGGLLIACPGGCRCERKELESVGLILNQAAGVIRRAVVHEEEIHRFRGRLETSSGFAGMVGKDFKMQVIYKMIEDVASTDATVLIQGESGTGKELVARAIHTESTRRDKPFVVINCSAYPSTLLESEIFGHEKGAFTGAVRQKAGRFEQADGGTVFLDEIGEIFPSAQIKLLRVLQTQKFERLGGERTLGVDVRILAATNKDLLEEVKKGRFREDLYYRLNVIPIRMPPLRTRRNDIPLLAKHFLCHFASEHQKRITRFSAQTMRMMLEYPWPGNVRELENSVEHAVVLARGECIEVTDLPVGLHVEARLAKEEGAMGLVDHEKRLVHEALEACGWNKKQAARRLGIGRSTLYEKIKRYDIVPPTKH